MEVVARQYHEHVPNADRIAGPMCLPSQHRQHTGPDDNDVKEADERAVPTITKVARRERQQDVHPRRDRQVRQSDREGPGD